ncbi:MAG: hypothetical protein WCI56_07685 [Hyphomicrobiales bacterium]
MTRPFAKGAGIGAGFGILTLILTCQTALAGPSMSSNWSATTLEQKECMQRAERVVRDAGLSRNFDIVGQSVFGQVDAYTAVVRCVTDKGVVIFVVAGPTLDEAKRHMRNIFDKF